MLIPFLTDILYTLFFCFASSVCCCVRVFIFFATISFKKLFVEFIPFIQESQILLFCLPFSFLWDFNILYLHYVCWMLIWYCVISFSVVLLHILMYFIIHCIAAKVFGLWCPPSLYLCRTFMDAPVFLLWISHFGFKMKMLFGRVLWLCWMIFYPLDIINRALLRHFFVYILYYAIWYIKLHRFMHNIMARIHHCNVYIK